MRYSIPKELDFFEAWQVGRVDDGSKKLRGYKWLTASECTTYNCIRNSLPILTLNLPPEHRIQSVINMIAEFHPHLKEKHKLVVNKDHEYWRKNVTTNNTSNNRNA